MVVVVVVVVKGGGGGGWNGRITRCKQLLVVCSHCVSTTFNTEQRPGKSLLLQGGSFNSLFRSSSSK